MEAPAAQPQVIIVPSPGLGHLIPLTELAKRLALYHNLFITFVIPSSNKYSPASALNSLLQSLPSNINSIYLPPANLDDLPEHTKIEVGISLTVTRSLPALRYQLLKSSSTHVSAVIVDMFGLSAIELVKEFDIPTYVFYTCAAMCFSLSLHMPKLDKTYSCEYRDLPEPIKFPGCVPLLGKDFADTAQDRNSENYKLMIERCKTYNSADGILINSFTDLEFGALQAFKEEKGLLKPPVYPVGPLVRSISSSSAASDRLDCLKWLDGQPKGSVLYVSFGSGGTLSSGQLNELAHGLEMSRQRFVWVVKSPNEKAANAHFFNIKSVENPSDFLPSGFLERTNGKGLIVPSWAPQVEILRHCSTGGFVTHCGWNSILESIVHGVIMIAWPLYAEQKMNAVLVTEGFGVGLRIKANNNSGLVGRDEIANLAKGLIEGEERKQLLEKMNQLQQAASMAWKEDGSSAKAVCEVAQKLSSFHVE